MNFQRVSKLAFIFYFITQQVYGQSLNHPKVRVDTTLMSNGGTSSGGGNGYLLTLPSNNLQGRAAYRALLEAKSIARSIAIVLEQMKGSNPQQYNKILRTLDLSTDSNFAESFATTAAGINRISFNPEIPQGNHAQFFRSNRTVEIDPVAMPWFKQDSQRFTLLVFHEVLGLMGLYEKDTKEAGYPTTSAFREALLANDDFQMLVNANLALTQNEFTQTEEAQSSLSASTKRFIENEMRYIWQSFANPSAIQTYLLGEVSRLKPSGHPLAIQIIPVANNSDRATQSIVTREEQEAAKNQIILATPVGSFDNSKKYKNDDQNVVIEIRDTFVTFGSHLLAASNADSFLSSGSLKYIEEETSAEGEFMSALFYAGMDIGTIDKIRNLWISLRKEGLSFTNAKTKEIAALYDSISKATDRDSAYQVLDDCNELSFPPYEMGGLYRRQSMEVVKALTDKWFTAISHESYPLQISDWRAQTTDPKTLLHKNWRRLFVTSNISSMLNALEGEITKELRIFVSYPDVPIMYSLIEYLRRESQNSISITVDRTLLERSEALRQIVPSNRRGQSFQYSGDDFKDFMNGLIDK